MRDTIIEEVRKARDDYARQFNYDLHAMCAELRREQRLGGAQVVSFPRRPVPIRRLDKAVDSIGDEPAS